MRTNHVLIDYESIQPEQLAPLDADHFRVTVFVGATQARLPFELAAAMQRLGSRAEYVKISGTGPNALDFHIAFYIGRLSAADPGTFFHVVSKDTGFDPLIQHLKSLKIFATRVADILDIPAVRAAITKTPEERLALVIDRLRTMKAGKPRTVKTLGTTIFTLFQKKLPEEEVDALLGALQGQGHVVITGTKVSYSLPTDGEGVTT
ncbi:MAG: PIN domain-containing protein [Burkholderiaceae bacterium]|jgi:hypothetical protein